MLQLRTNPKVPKEPKEPKQKQKIGSQRFSDGTTKRKGVPLEDMFNLAAMVRIELEGRKVGGYLLQKDNNSFMVTFGFECMGIHPTMRAEQIDPVFDAIEAGLKDFPQGGECLTIHMSSFTSDVLRQRQLQTLAEKAPADEMAYLLFSERQRVAELTAMGLRKPKALYFYCTYTVEPGSVGASDPIEKFISQCDRAWKDFTGQLAKSQFVQLEQLLAASYATGFQQWEQLLSNKLGLNLRVLNDTELWEILWYRLNSTKPIEVPQVLVLTENGLTEEVRSELSPLTLLAEGPVPVPDRRWVHANGKYIGVLPFVDKPGGWLGKQSQLRYLWDVFAKEKIFDTEVFCQMTRANEGMVKANMQRLTKQANTATDIASRGNSIDVKAQLNIKKGVEAQEALYEGAVPFHTSVVFLVHRKSASALDDACNYLSSLFLRPAWVAREEEYPFLIWTQTFPICWQRLLAKPFNRRHVYLNTEVPGLMPIVLPRTSDSVGLELIAAEGGSPIFVDLYTKHKNLMLFGTTRSGKSVIASGILTQALAYGMPIVCMDYPKPDGSSTFTDYTEFMGDRGSYFNISKESSNLFELPDLSMLPPEQQKERLEDYKDFLIQALMTMIVGAKGGDTAAERSFSDTVRSILTLAVDAFFADDLIRDRYAQAFVGGFGSDFWQTMPTLHDFLGYCSYERLKMDGVSDDIKTAMQQIKLRLNFWLTSRVGKSISRPSTFRADSQLLVFALANLSNDEDAAVLSLSAYSAALRRALAFPASIFFIDESPILFEYGSISQLVGRLCANGAKAGVRVILSAQEPISIANSAGGAKIFANMTTRLVGRIQATAVDAFVDILKYPREIIARNASESFFPKKESIYSQWLLDDMGTYTQARFYPAFALLAAVANNPNEQQARTAAMRRYSNKFLGLNTFAQELVASIRAS